ncbi:MAG TPA: RNA 2',3'-cyclic phosphodiesterase [bacterium]|nr:RNA 2',3'-cyclic phosphodiesterase [bacterium]
MMRCFIAILLSDSVRNQIAELQEDLRRSGLKLKWVAPENIHLTLQFLGEITEEQAGKVVAILEQAAAQTHAFELAAEGIGQFPPKGTPRVVWVGLNGETEPLMDLDHRIREALKREQIPFDDKPFHPHLTIARVEQGFRGPLRTSEKARQFHAGTIAADAVNLMKSDLRPSGPVYTSLGHWDFKSVNHWSVDENGRILLPRYKHCFVCGSQNPAGVHLEFAVKDGKIETSFIPRPEHCGYRGVVHGGVLTAVLDECMGWTIISRRKTMCITVEVTLRFKQRAMAGQRLYVSAECVDCRSRLMSARGQITDGEGNILCTGHGKFIPLTDEENEEVERYAGWENALEEVHRKITERE